MMSKHEERLQQFADELIKKIEANEAPWQKGWVSGMGDVLPVNHQGKPYRGNNLLDLMMVAQAKGYSDNRWYTFNNAKDYGGHVRKGEKGTVITFFSRTKTENKKDEQGNSIYGKDGKPEKVTYLLDRPIITTAVVFNAEQIEGLPPRELTTPLSEWERIERAEAIAQGIQSQGVTIEHKLGDRAYYSSTDDKIVMPERGQFSTPDAYYATLLHEIGHATGHESRLNRDLSSGFGSESYAKEELRAEIASMIVGEQLQIGYDPSQHHAYLKSWAKVIKEDPKEILRAVKDADAISEYVLSFSKDLEITTIKEKRTSDLKNEPYEETARRAESLQQERLYLYTSFNDLNDLRKLKEQGIVKFDTQNKVWYANEQNKDAVARWIVRPNLPSPEQEFADYLTANGITVEAGHPIFDDRTHRLSNNGSTDKNVMYQAYANPNGVPFARVTNFSRGDVPENWQYPKEYLNTLRNIEAVERAKGSSYKPSSPTLSVNNPVQPTLSPKERDEAKIAKANEMAEISKVIVSISDVAPPTQNYLSNKQVTANDTVLIVPHSSKLSDEFKDRVMIADTFKQAKYYRENNPDEKLILQRGNLVVPQYNTQGELRAFETIAYNGGKYALKDADKKGLMTTLGNLENGKPIIITEGYATGATLHEHTRKDKPAVVIAFGRGGLMNVTQSLREKYPDSKIYIGADNDHQKPLEIDPLTKQPKINQGLEDARAVANVVSNTHLLVPQFEKGDTGKDWNDVYVDKGAEEFKRQIIEQLNAINRPIVAEKDKEKNITQAPIGKAQEPVQQQPSNVYDRLATNVIKKNYPAMPEENLKSIEVWRNELPNKYDEPLKLQYALERLEAKLPDYAKGEILPLPKTEVPSLEKGVGR